MFLCDILYITHKSHKLKSVLSYMGPILNTIIGAGIKLACNLLNAWLEQKRQDQLALAARDEKMLDALIASQEKNANDPFVKVTRRILFMSITFTMCFLMIYYAFNPQIEYSLIVPKGDSGKLGFVSWIFGGKDWEMVKMTGGLMLASFMDLCFMVVGFYAIPSKRR
ncbi:MAG: hypothetical protein CL833_01020 [Crocinitomicaceae bacterium]|nr:hypothetical protein [Crocinitomicaceae bacterium]